MLNSEPAYLDETRRPDCYRHWIAKWDTLRGDQLLAIRYRVGFLPRRPAFSVVPLADSGADVLRPQLYPRWELAADTEPTGDYIIPLPPDAELPRHALFEIAAGLAAHPGTTMLFTDEDQRAVVGSRHSPRFRTEYDPDLMLGQNTVGSLAVYSRDLFRRAGGVRLDLPPDLACYDLALRAAAITEPASIRHLPAVLCHRTTDPDGETEAIRDLVRAHLPVGTTLVPAPLAPAWNRIIHPLPDPPPLISLIVPTRDRADLLRICADAVLRRTDYPRIELLIADNGSTEAETLALLAELAADSRMRVLPCPGPFNWSAINNAAVAAARGEVLVFLNNDIDVTDAGWLRELVSQAMRPEVGIVGARLLYPDGRVQHAGIVVPAGGWPVHLYRYTEGSDPGYLGQLALVRSYSAVTGACMAMRRDVFDAVGGFEDRDLAVTFNDVDICLRVRAAGWRVICTPFAELVHREQATRGSDSHGENHERFMRERQFVLQSWGPSFERDPFCSPNLKFEFDAVRLARPPRVIRPWREV